MEYYAAQHFGGSIKKAKKAWNLLDEEAKSECSDQFEAAKQKYIKKFKLFANALTAMVGYFVTLKIKRCLHNFFSSTGTIAVFRRIRSESVIRLLLGKSTSISSVIIIRIKSKILCK